LYLLDSDTWTCRKFGKQIQRRQLDLPEYAASFVNYKALKKVSYPEVVLSSSQLICRCQLIKQLSATPTIPAQSTENVAQNVPDSQAALRANKEVFFFKLVCAVRQQEGVFSLTGCSCRSVKSKRSMPFIYKKKPRFARTVRLTSSRY
jgi:hypothetical protein